MVSNNILYLPVEKACQTEVSTLMIRTILNTVISFFTGHNYLTYFQSLWLIGSLNIFFRDPVIVSISLNLFPFTPVLHFAPGNSFIFTKYLLHFSRNIWRRQNWLNLPGFFDIFWNTSLSNFHKMVDKGSMSEYPVFLYH